jgi:hypothetical protein
MDFIYNRECVLFFIFLNNFSKIEKQNFELRRGMERNKNVDK